MSMNTLKVIVRVRPNPLTNKSSEKHSISDTRVCLRIPDASEVGDTGGSIVNTIYIDRDKKGKSDFRFSEGAVLPSTSTQLDVYSHCNLITDVIDGLNCCVMAYGQTSSGKTHSMYGKGWDEDSFNDATSSVINDMNDSGVIPRSVDDLFSKLDEKALNAPDDFDFTVNCQILQIYNEKIYDLLQDKKRENPLQLREAGSKSQFYQSNNSVHIPGMSLYRVHSKEDVINLLIKGLKNRAVRATNMNVESSRSHTILQLFIQIEQPDEDGLIVLKKSTFSLVDLAGSEKWRAALDGTSINNAKNINKESKRREEQEKEMVNINSSLAALGNVVSALLESNRKHIPYRDSSLTRLLQDALGGNGKTVMIATVHEAQTYMDETFSTLQFANRASRIRMTVNSYETSSEKITLDGAKRQIRMLRARLQEISNINMNMHMNNHDGMDLTGISQTVATNQCACCVDLLDRCKQLLKENLAMKAHFGGDNNNNNMHGESKKKKGILETIMAPFYGNKNSKTPSPIKQSIPQNKSDGMGVLKSPSNGSRLLGNSGNIPSTTSSENFQMMRSNDTNNVQPHEMSASMDKSKGRIRPDRLSLSPKKNRSNNTNSNNGISDSNSNNSSTTNTPTNANSAKQKALMYMKNKHKAKQTADHHQNIQNSPEVHNFGKETVHTSPSKRAESALEAARLVLNVQEIDTSSQLEKNENNVQDRRSSLIQKHLPQHQMTINTNTRGDNTTVGMNNEEHQSDDDSRSKPSSSIPTSPIHSKTNLSPKGGVNFPPKALLPSVVDNTTASVLGSALELTPPRKIISSTMVSTDTHSKQFDTKPFETERMVNDTDHHHHHLPTSQTKAEKFGNGNVSTDITMSRQASFVSTGYQSTSKPEPEAMSYRYNPNSSVNSIGSDSVNMSGNFDTPQHSLGSLGSHKSLLSFHSPKSMSPMRSMESIESQGSIGSNRSITKSKKDSGYDADRINRIINNYDSNMSTTTISSTSKMKDIVEEPDYKIERTSTIMDTTTPSNISDMNGGASHTVSGSNVLNDALSRSTDWNKEININTNTNSGSKNDLPYVLAYQKDSEPTAVVDKYDGSKPCAKHDLEDCILCLMFKDDSVSTTNNTGNVSSVVGGGSPSYLNTTSVPSSSYLDESTALTSTYGMDSSVSNSIDGLMNNNSKECVSHGVADCLLCALNANPSYSQNLDNITNNYASTLSTTYQQQKNTNNSYTSSVNAAYPPIQGGQNVWNDTQTYVNIDHNNNNNSTNMSTTYDQSSQEALKSNTDYMDYGGGGGGEGSQDIRQQREINSVPSTPSSTLFDQDEDYNFNAQNYNYAGSHMNNAQDGKKIQSGKKLVPVSARSRLEATKNISDSNNNNNTVKKKFALQKNSGNLKFLKKKNISYLTEQDDLLSNQPDDLASYLYGNNNDDGDNSRDDDDNHGFEDEAYNGYTKMSPNRTSLPQLVKNNNLKRENDFSRVIQNAHSVATRSKKGSTTKKTLSSLASKKKKGMLSKKSFK